MKGLKVRRGCKVTATGTGRTDFVAVEEAVEETYQTSAGRGERQTLVIFLSEPPWSLPQERKCLGELSLIVTSILNLTNSWVCHSPPNSADLNLVTIPLILLRNLRNSRRPQLLPFLAKYLPAPSDLFTIPIAVANKQSFRRLDKCHLGGAMEK